MDNHIPTKPIVPNSNDDEIDLLALAKTLWDGRYTILKYMLFAGALGIFIALFTPKVYTSSTTMVPQLGSSGSKLGGLSSLAAMAGFNIDMGSSASDALSPTVYPQIVSSGPFQLELMNTPFSFEEVDHPVSLYEYYTVYAKPDVLSQVSKYTIGLPFVILKAIKGENVKKTIAVEKGPFAFSQKQELVRKMLDKQIEMVLDPKQGFITIQTSFPEALLSAQVADQARELLQKYITHFKIEKASSQLAFIEERYAEKKKDFEKTQERLAYYSDQNKNMSSAVALTSGNRLQSEFNIAMNVYNELSKQLEQAKIKEKEETPVFSVLQPAVIPAKSTKPNKAMIVLIWLFLGAILGTAIIFGKQYLPEFKQKWNKGIIQPIISTSAPVIVASEK